MQVRCGSILILTLTVCASACQFDQDTVGAGYYGVMSAGRGAAAPTTSSNSTQAETGAAGMAAAVKTSGASSPATTVGMTGSTSTTTATASAPGMNASPTGPANASCDMVTADFRGAWPAIAAEVNFKGRKGTSVAAADGCKIDLQKWYTVRGATLPYYLDPNNPLPTADDQAASGKPGWEDWDGDGHPGITGMLSGVVSGKIFVAPRMWTQVSGTAPDVRSVIKLPLQWNQEPNVMSYDGTPLLGSEAARAADASLHFVQFARLDATQAAGDDAAICKSVVALAPMLTADAAGR